MERMIWIDVSYIARLMKIGTYFQNLDRIFYIVHDFRSGCGAFERRYFSCTSYIFFN